MLRKCFSPIRFLRQNSSLSKYTPNEKLNAWIKENVSLCQPTSVHVCNGTEEEYQMLIKTMVESKTIIPLKQRPNSYLALSDVSDVARVESRTYICSKTKEDAGPTNNWIDPEEMKIKLKQLYAGSMKGRKMYVVPFSMGPLGGPISKIGVELTDSPYVAASMRVMTRMGQPVLNLLGKDGHFVPCMHSVGKPINSREDDVAWPCNSVKYIAHFPEERSIYSYGSSYGGNALLGKKCYALRIASVMGRDEGWLAEHMLILGITNPEGKKKYVVAAFPSACGKTNLAMLTPTIPGWKVETVGDDIAWMKFGPDGRLYAINPENGFFGVAPGTSFTSNYNAMKAIEKNTIFTNVGLTPDGDVWWEGMTSQKPAKLVDWLGKDWTPDSKNKAAHGNSRFCAPIQQCPILDSDWENPQGVPISAILFGGRRDKTIPLVLGSRDWNHGVLFGASISSEQTEAAEGTGVRHDPFAMLPFCGYNMAKYWQHWIDMGKKTTANELPKIFQVNWFRKNDQGKYIWPGFGENSRVLKWVFEMSDGKPGVATETPVGFVPSDGALDTKGLDVDPQIIKNLFEIKPNEWKDEFQELSTYFEKFGTDLPKEFVDEMATMKKKL